MARREDIDEEEDEDVDGDLVQAEVAILLTLPFEEAFAACEALRNYIQEHDDAAALKEEFRASWTEEAPAALRQVLEELLNPEAAAANAAAVRAFQQDPLSGGGGPPMGGGFPSGTSEGGLGGGFGDERGPQGTSRTAPSRRIVELEEQASVASEQDSVAAEGPTMAEVRTLLAMPFEKAMAVCEPLRQYIAQQADSADLEEEFRANWHLEAPAPLRQVLEELLDPAAAAATVASVQAFRKDPLQAAVDTPVAGHPHRPVEAEHEEEEEEEEDEEDHGDIIVEVDRLLAMDFKDAMAHSAELRGYVRDREDADEVEEEFALHWSPDAPKALRAVLEELLWPAMAEAARAAAPDPPRSKL